MLTVAPVAEIVKRVPSKQLVSLYKIPAFKTAEELLAAVAGARGKLRKGGVPDTRAASRIILQVGALPVLTPPIRTQIFFLHSRLPKSCWLPWQAHASTCARVRCLTFTQRPAPPCK